jgi:hypothetical protein
MDAKACSLSAEQTRARAEFNAFLVPNNRTHCFPFAPLRGGTGILPVFRPPPSFSFSSYAAERRSHFVRFRRRPSIPQAGPVISESDPHGQDAHATPIPWAGRPCHPFRTVSLNVSSRARCLDSSDVAERRSRFVRFRLRPVGLNGGARPKSKRQSPRPCAPDCATAAMFAVRAPYTHLQRNARGACRRSCG